MTGPADILEPLLRLYGEAAETGAPTPSSTRLAPLLGVSRCTVQKAARLLADDGRIVIEEAARGQTQRITITATGKRTAWTSKAAPQPAGLWPATHPMPATPADAPGPADREKKTRRCLFTDCRREFVVPPSDPHRRHCRRCIETGRVRDANSLPAQWL